MGKRELIDLTVSLHAETAKAILVSDDGTKERAVWIPKSQCEVEPHERYAAIVTVTMPEWMAKDKGLI